MDAWIDCEKQMPEESDRYAVIYVSSTTRKPFIADYDPFYGWSCKLPDVQITHWLPLPDMPATPVSPAPAVPASV